MVNYWTNRIKETREKASAASTDDLRDIYNNLVEHYESMLRFTPVAPSDPVSLRPSYSGLSRSVSVVDRSKGAPAKHSMTF